MTNSVPVNNARRKRNNPAKPNTNGRWPGTHFNASNPIFRISSGIITLSFPFIIRAHQESRKDTTTFQQLPHVVTTTCDGRSEGKRERMSRIKAVSDTAPDRISIQSRRLEYNSDRVNRQV